MDTSTAKDLIEILAGRSSAWHALWTVFYTVAAAIVGIVASGKLLSQHRKIASLIAVGGFLVFAAGNFVALDEMRQQREAVVEFVEAKAQDKEHASPEILKLAQASAPPSSAMLRAYHWSLCAFVVLLVVFIPRYLSEPKNN